MLRAFYGTALSGRSWYYGGSVLSEVGIGNGVSHELVEGTPART